MRLLIHTGSESGHLRPALPIARAWSDRRHEVIFATGGPARNETEESGFEFVELPAVEGVGGPQFRRSLEEMDALGRARAVLGMFFDTAIGRTQPLAEVAKDWMPDVILGESTSWAALFVAELTDTPAATFDYNPADARILSELIGDRFAEFRAALGLPADPDLTALNRWLTLVGGPPEWFSSRPLPPTAHLIQPPDADAHAHESVDDLLRSMDRRPLVYATLGTTFNAQRGVWSTVLEGLSEVDANVVATVGRDLDPAEFGPQPPNVHVERFISQSLILPHCAAMLAHGGYGSLMGALRKGVPVVSVPLAAADNRRNATKLEKLGAGIAVHEDSRSAGAIKHAVTSILTKPSYREAARGLAASIASLPPTSYGAALLERLARERQPIER